MDALLFYGRAVKDGKSDDSPRKLKTLGISPRKSTHSPEEPDEKKAAKLRKIQFSILAPSPRYCYGIFTLVIYLNFFVLVLVSRYTEHTF